jgi:hypothetical protein
MFNSNFPNMNNFIASQNHSDFNLNGQGMLSNPTLNYLYLIQYQQAIIQNLQNMEGYKQGCNLAAQSNNIQVTQPGTTGLKESHERVSFKCNTRTNWKRTH